jgi:GT2 family glycosyltransferase
MSLAINVNSSGGRRNPEISICIPAYNRPAELREAVASALAQTVTDLEVVVTDDSDLHQDLTREFADDRLRYYANLEQLGMAANWQRALSLARGRFIGLLMDDDRLLPTFIERCLAAFVTDPAIGVVFTNHLFDDGAHVVPRASLISEGTYQHFLPLLLRYKPVAICATLMRREVWDQVLPVPDMHTADLALHIRAAQAGWSFHYIDAPLMIYRVNHAQLSGQIGFRDHGVALWRLFRFEEGSEEEVQRRRLFAEALLSSAAAHMQRGDFGRAKELAQEAAALGVRSSSELTRRARVISAISKSRFAMNCAARGFKLAKWARS